MKNSNPCTSIFIEFHILQSFPVTCLNRDDVCEFSFQVQGFGATL